MTYGIASPQTRQLLRHSGIEDGDLEHGPYRIDIVWEGALDESFDIVEAHAHEAFSLLREDFETRHEAEVVLELYNTLPEPPELVERFEHTPEGGW